MIRSKVDCKIGSNIAVFILGVLKIIYLFWQNHTICCLLQSSHHLNTYKQGRQIYQSLSYCLGRKKMVFLSHFQAFHAI